MFEPAANYRTPPPNKRTVKDEDPESDLEEKRYCSYDEGGIKREKGSKKI